MAIEISKCPNCGVRLRFDRSTIRKIKCPRCSVVRMSSEYMPVGDQPAPAEDPVRKPEPKQRHTSQKVKGQCPECGRKIVIPAGISVTARLKCPQCARVGSFADFTDHTSNSESDVAPTETAGGESTQIIDPAAFRPGSLVFVSDDNSWTGSKQPIHLKIGKNMIGRRAQKMSVEVPLPTVDDQMSRRHAVIEMVKSANGSIRHYISDAGSTNGTYVNGVLLRQGEEIGLVKGTVIKMGKTVLRFEII